MGDCDWFKLVIYHGGILNKFSIEYKGGIEERVGRIDVDKWSYQCLRALLRDLGYINECIYHWHMGDENILVVINNENIFGQNCMCLCGT